MPNQSLHDTHVNAHICQVRHKLPTTAVATCPSYVCQSVKPLEQVHHGLWAKAAALCTEDKGRCGLEQLFGVLCCVTGELLSEALVCKHCAAVVALGLRCAQVDRVFGLTVSVKHVANPNCSNLTCPKPSIEAEGNSCVVAGGVAQTVDNRREALEVQFRQ